MWSSKENFSTILLTLLPQICYCMYILEPHLTNYSCVCMCLHARWVGRRWWKLFSLTMLSGKLPFWPALFNLSCWEIYNMCSVYMGPSSFLPMSEKAIRPIHYPRFMGGGGVSYLWKCKTSTPWNEQGLLILAADTVCSYLLHLLASQLFSICALCMMAARISHYF